jgi:hypothetical protein
MFEVCWMSHVGFSHPFDWLSGGVYASFRMDKTGRQIQQILVPAWTRL